MRYVFGDYALDAQRYELRRGGTPIKVRPKVFEVLAYLAAGSRPEGLSMPGQCQRWSVPSAWRQFLTTMQQTEWVVYAKPPLAAPYQILRYLARYTHRVAMTNRRLLALQDGQVTFRWKDYHRGNRLRTITLDAVEFLRRFLLHVLPRGFKRIRHYGCFANGVRTAMLPRCRSVLGQAPLRPADVSPPVDSTTSASRSPAPSDVCPACHVGRM